MTLWDPVIFILEGWDDGDSLARSRGVVYDLELL